MRTDRALLVTTTYDSAGRPVRFETFGNEHLPVRPYSSPADVPVPLRHTLRQAHQSGLTLENLALVFELPIDWLRIFTAPDEQHPKNIS